MSTHVGAKHSCATKPQGKKNRRTIIANLNLGRNERITLVIAFVAALASGVLHFRHGNAVLTFVISAAALSCLAMLVGHATEQVGSRLNAGATGVLQSALGNLPELFVCIFSLRAGLVTVVQSALIGSILANSLLVMGLAIFVGGLKHGTQRFNSEAPRMIATLMLLAVSALAIPTLAHQLHTPAAAHSEVLSAACAVVLLLVFAASLPFSLKGDPSVTPLQAAPGSTATHNAQTFGAPELEAAHFNTAATEEAAATQATPATQATTIATSSDAFSATSSDASSGVVAEEAPHAAWPMWLAVAILVFAGVGAALVSDWFVEALSPTMKSLHLSEAFTGLVIVAIAGNAVENVVGIQLAARNKPDYAISVILNSSLQIALFLIPALVLLSFVLGGAHLTLVLPPLLVAALALTSLVSTFIVYDGESIWLEGVALIGLYGIIAAAFWWG